MMLFKEGRLFCLFVLATLQLFWGGEGKLLFVSSSSHKTDKVWMIPTPSNGSDNGTPTRTPTSLSNFTKYPSRMSCDARRNELLLRTSYPKEKKLYRILMDKNDTVTGIVDTGLEGSRGVAHDWITGNVYLAYATSIVVCNQDLSLCSVLIKDSVHYPDDIVVEPNLGLMFWINNGEQPSIYRAGMDGTSPKPIVSFDKNRDIPMRISLDIQQDLQKTRVFWIYKDLSDGQKESLESVRVDGSERRTVVMASNKGFVFPNWKILMGVLGERVFWSQYISGSETIASANKDTVLDEKIHYQNAKRHFTYPDYFYGLGICDPESEPIYRLSNPCRDSGCSHICTPSFETGHRCSCPGGMVLEGGEGGTICIHSPTTSPYLYVAGRNKIGFARLESVGRIDLESVTVPELKSITALTPNPTKTNSLILSDSVQKKIYEYDMSTKKAKLLVRYDIDTVVDLDVDPIGGNLYWADAGKQTVEVISLRTKARVTLITGIENPLDISIVPELGSIFVSIFDSLGGKILKYQLNGVSSTIISVYGNHPVALNYRHHNKVMYWIDKVAQRLRYRSLRGNFSSSGVTLDGGPISDVIIFNLGIYWLDSSSQELKWSSFADKSSSSYETEDDRDVYRGLTYPGLRELLSSNRDWGLKSGLAASKNMSSSTIQDLLESHECSWKNNPRRKNCSHICLPTGEGDGGECRCPVGFQLGEDGRRCKEEIFNWTGCPHTEFRCGDGSCIGMSLICDGTPDCGGVEGAGGGEDEAESTCGDENGQITTLAVILISIETSLILTTLLLVGYWLYRKCFLKVQANEPVVCVGDKKLAFEEDTL